MSANGFDSSFSCDRVARSESPKYNQYYCTLETMSEEVLQRLQGFRHLAEQIARESPPPRSSDSALTKVVEGTIGRQASSLVVSKDLGWLVSSRTIDSAARKFVRNSVKEADKKALQEWNRSCQARID